MCARMVVFLREGQTLIRYFAQKWIREQDELRFFRAILFCWHDMMCFETARRSAGERECLPSGNESRRTASAEPHTCCGPEPRMNEILGFDSDTTTCIGPVQGSSALCFSFSDGCISPKFMCDTLWEIVGLSMIIGRTQVDDNSRDVTEEFATDWSCSMLIRGLSRWAVHSASSVSFQTSWSKHSEIQSGVC